MTPQQTDHHILSRSKQVFEQEHVLSALERSVAMIEFNTEGKVLWANDNFASTLGYHADEMPGLLHRVFCTEEFSNSPSYQEFWMNLGSGKIFQEKIQRLTKDQRLVWLEATYSPVFNDDGDVVGVVKVATDITERENNTIEVTTQLQQMSSDLIERAQQGIKRSDEMALATVSLVKESDENITILNSLKEQAKSLEEIASTIKDVASQTNLLALNAAIEAAHAGEHGRGFEIVASEVRKLANRVQESTKEANRHISGITTEIQKISEGTIRSQKGISTSQELVEQALEAFKEIGIAANQLDSQANVYKNLF